MVGLGTLPLLATSSRLALPLWWNHFQFPLFLVGAVGSILLGVSTKGVDQHSTQTQVQQATAEDKGKYAKKQP